MARFASHSGKLPQRVPLPLMPESSAGASFDLQWPAWRAIFTGPSGGSQSSDVGMGPG